MIILVFSSISKLKLKACHEFNLGVFSTAQLRTPGRLLADIIIQGGDEQLAEAILILAVKHCIAAQAPLPERSGDISNLYVAELDMYCFYSELNHMAAF